MLALRNDVAGPGRDANLRLELADERCGRRVVRGGDPRSCGRARHALTATPTSATSTIQQAALPGQRRATDVLAVSI